MKNAHWRRRLTGLLCALILTVSLCPTAMAGTDGLPADWWKVWGPYADEAVPSGDAEQIYRTGLAVEKLYTAQPLNMDIADQLVKVYDRLLDLRYFENKGDYAGAADNTRKLMKIAQYLTDNGVDYTDSIIECQAHLEVLGPFTGVYAASNTKGDSYGSKLAPASGTWYGSVFQGYFAESGKGSIASVYVELAKESVVPQEYILAKFNDGKHAVEVNLNYTDEGATARAITAGQCDANIDATLRALAKYSCPIVLRIGGEMNIWSDAKNPTAAYVSPEDFIASYRYIANKARSLCPKVELVWSPMYSTRWGETLDDFYPGDSYVDWVGLSLYYNYADKGYTEASWLEHNRIHEFADPLLCVKNVAEFAAKHNKPVIATEGGAYKNGPKGEAYAAAANAKAFAVVNMVYPQVKALVYFDMNISEIDGKHDYTMTGSFRTAALDAIENNPTLISAGESSAAVYVPLEQFREKADRLVIGATGYTYNDTDMKVTYTLDNGSAVSGIGAANRYELTAAQLGTGAHTLKVTFTDKKGYTETKTYNVTASDGTIRCGVGAAAPATPPAPAAKPTVVKSPQKLSVNGAARETEIYNIDNTNYFKLRDLAALLNGTGAQFNVDFNSATNTIVVRTGTPYTTANGYELQTGVDNSGSAVVSAQSLEIDGQRVDLTAYNIGGTNFFGLRALEPYIGYTVGWDPAANTATITSP